LKKVLIAIDEFSKSSKLPLEMLDSADFEVLNKDLGVRLDQDKDAEKYKAADYVIAGLETYHKDFFERFPNICAISRVGVGVDNIDLESAAAHNVKVFITSDKPSVAVAELCVSNMIILLRHTFEMSNHLKRGIWQPVQGRELRSSTVGIIGMGSIGKQVVKRVSSFGSKIIGYARTWDEEFGIRFNVKRKDIKEVFEEANVITIHLPLTRETNMLISKNLIDSVQPGTVILNTSRASVMDNQALLNAINSERVQGAAVDVFAEDKDPYPFGSAERVILTPHIGSHTIETRQAMEKMAVMNLLTYESLRDNNDSVKTREILTYIDKHTIN
jgi:D-3-phosphoglycerate dehydrogenase / 2-oxoglutarate reductase